MGKKWRSEEVPCFAFTSGKCSHLFYSLTRDVFKSLRFGLRYYLSELLKWICAESNSFLKVSNKLKNSVQAHEAKGKSKIILCLIEPLKTEFLVIYINLVGTPQETHCVSATNLNRLMLCRKHSLFIARTIWNKKISQSESESHFD
jgi:hypothetical protein